MLWDSILTFRSLARQRLLHTLQLLLDGTTVATLVGIALGDHRSITQDCSKCTTRSLDLLHILQLLLDSTAVATRKLTTQSDDRSIIQDCSECVIGSLDLLHISQLIPYRTDSR